jgi:hypothetical protein
MKTISTNTWKILLAPMTAAVVLIGCSAPAEPKPAPVQTRQTLKKTTQNVLELSEAMKQGGVRAEMSITGQGLDVAADAVAAKAPIRKWQTRWLRMLQLLLLKPRRYLHWMSFYRNQQK